MTYAADGLGVSKKFVPFLNDAAFDAAWQDTARINAGLWGGGGLPDIRWRAHVCAWAASNCLRLDGDFAEFGVNTGILSSMILKTVDGAAARDFYLFDTFAGIPEDMADARELAHTRAMNAELYGHDGLAVARKVFDGYDRVNFVVGRLPDTIAGSGLGNIAYASIDLNSVTAEMAVAEEIWDRIVAGGMIVLDDYGFGGHELQNRAWNAFAAARDRRILGLPTGQGLLQK